MPKKTQQKRRNSKKQKRNTKRNTKRNIKLTMRGGNVTIQYRFSSEYGVSNNINTNTSSTSENDFINKMEKLGHLYQGKEDGILYFSQGTGL